MRKLYFKPMPVLSVILLIGVAVLIGLGAWQYQRLQWKTALLSEVEASVTAPPLTSLKSIQTAIEAGDPVDFRRIEFMGSKFEEVPFYHLYKSQSGGIFWDVVEPIGTPDRAIFAKTQTLKNAEKDKPRENLDVSLRNYTGYVRKIYPMGKIESWVKSKPNRESNRYFHFNQTNDWYEGVKLSLIEGYYIDIDLADSSEDLPIRRPDIRNNHFDYMLTWWFFAVIFIVIYLILHRRAGRLKLI